MTELKPLDLDRLKEFKFHQLASVKYDPIGAALAVADLTAEVDRLRAAVARVETLCDKYEQLDDFVRTQSIRAALRGES